MLIKLDFDTYVSSEEIASLEKSHGGYFNEGWGCIVTLKNGRKILVKSMEPKEVYELIKTDKTSHETTGKKKDQSG